MSYYENRFNFRVTILIISYICGLSLSLVSFSKLLILTLAFATAAAGVLYVMKSKFSKYYNEALPALLVIAALLLFGYLRGVSISANNQRDVNYMLMRDSFVKLRGRVERVKKYENGKGFSAVLNVSSVYEAKNSDKRNLYGRVFLNVSSPPGSLALNDGDYIEVSGRIEAAAKLRNPYIYKNSNPFLPRTLFKIKLDYSNLKVIEPSRNFIISIRAFFKSIFLDNFPPEISGFLIAFCIGDSSYISDSLYFDDSYSRQFSESGMIHILVVSGSHITLMISFIGIFLGFAKIGGRLKCYIVLIMVLIYYMLVGVQAAVTRACLAYALSVAAGFADRRLNRYDVFMTAFFVHLIIFPYYIFDFGFWLSYISTFAVLASSEIVFMDEIDGMPGIFLSGFISSAKISFFAMAATYPLICYMSGYVALISLLANIFTLWIYELILALCAVFIAVALFSAFLAKLAAPALYYISFAALKLNEAISVIDAGNISIYKLGLAEMIFWYLSIISAGYYISRKKDISFLKIAPLFIAVIAVIFIRNQIFLASEGFEITFLDVGQGDCALIRTGRGKWIMIDAGGDKYAYDSSILPFIKYRNIKEIEYLIITHPHSDHYINAIKLLDYNKTNIKEIIFSTYESKELDFIRLIKKASRKNIMRSGDKIALDGVLIDVLWPPKAGLSAMTVNDTSIAAVLTYKGKSVFFGGDISSCVEEKLLNDIKKYDIFFLKASHHGSNTSNSEKIINAALPPSVFISSGAGNKFGHPHKKSIDNFKKYSAKIFDSQKTGGILIGFNKKKFSVYDFSLLVQKIL